MRLIRYGEAKNLYHTAMLSYVCGIVTGLLIGGAAFAVAYDWNQQWNPQLQQLQHQQEVEAQKQQLERWQQEQHRQRLPC